MIVSEKIDWLSITYPSNTKLTAMLPPYIKYRTERIKSPIPVYPIAYQVEPLGARILMGDERLGTHMILSGQSLDACREHEIDLIEIWNIVQDLQGKVSRIDLAVDVMDNKKFTPKAVYEKHLNGYCDTQLVGSKFIGSEDNMETFYIGNIASQSRKLRVYDKAVEQGIPDKVWTRIEYEKRRRANNTAIAHFDRKTSVRDIINSTVSFPSWKVWSDIMGAKLGKIPRTESKEKDWKEKLAWMLDNYPRAIVNTLVLEYRDKLDGFTFNESDVLNTFNAVLLAEIKRAQTMGNLPMSKHENTENE